MRRPEARLEVQFLVGHWPVPFEDAVVDLLVLDPEPVGLEATDARRHTTLLTLDHTSAKVAVRIAQQLDTLGADAGPFDRLATILEAFLPQDPDSRAAMQVYLHFASAAMADPVLRRADAFANGHALIDVLATELSEMAATHALAPDIDPGIEARGLLALVLGLSMGILLEQTSAPQALEVLRTHLERIRRTGTV
ncbi:TetR family transcriptional regulator C-terminal domain-containing protein [Salsipaludibacter albus]|uniref:TetR family transcriptional regulator C-terminal domain-containing protein n=1 Tax=Salsipaludibacter albus TaxID=2849650 RepID=UPI001EE4244E|nr:TetR family transcriptional regulator C-terminal domain-containing protein [Salsipaludibacter albus]MBY5162652.1 TetR family transcriptional regulator C-terminal domain-containing protein [Salsipaludibacter albus]